MDIIIKSRGHGKTSELVRLSAQTGIPIVSRYSPTIQKCANELGLEIPDPISMQEFAKMEQKPKSVYIDDFHLVIKRLLGSEVAGFTDTLDDTLVSGSSKEWTLKKG